MIVEWYRHGHEHRNDMLRFGLMRLHHEGALAYREYPLAMCTQAGFSASVATHEHRHTSVLAIRDGQRITRIVVDSEDSFFWMSPLVHDCDVYFCSGYSRQFFEKKAFIEPYPWQTAEELLFYRNRAQWLVEEHGSAFARVKPYIPIAPNMGLRQPPAMDAGKSSLADTVMVRLKNLRHKVNSRLSPMKDWREDFANFEKRYQELLSYRTLPQQYDVVLLDSLWGWPRHRVALHEKLASLSTTHKIHSRLNWSDPHACDAGDRSGLDPGTFPRSTGSIGDYETMLAQSRIGVFATGFHFGWRNIMTLALMMGLPVLTDRLVVEPWFDMKMFDFIETDAFGLGEVEKAIAQYPDTKLSALKQHNQEAYDDVMSPEAVARYVVFASPSIRRNQTETNRGVQ